MPNQLDAFMQGPLHEEYISAPLQLPRLRCFRLNFESFRVVVEDPFAWLPRGLPSFLMNCLALEELVVTCAGAAPSAPPSGPHG